MKQQMTAPPLMHANASDETRFSFLAQVAELFFSARVRTLPHVESWEEQQARHRRTRPADSSPETTSKKVLIANLSSMR